MSSLGGGAQSSVTGFPKRKGNLDIDTEGRPCIDKWPRWSFTSQGERPQKKPALLIPWSWTSGLQNCEKINILCLRHLVRDFFFLCQPWQTVSNLDQVKNKSNQPKEEFKQKKESDVSSLSTLGPQEKTQKCRGKSGLRITMAYPGSEVNTYLEININLGY